MSSTPLASSRSPIRRTLRPVLVIASMIGLTVGVVTPVLGASTITLISGAGTGDFGTPDPNVTYVIPAIGASGPAVVRHISGGYGTIDGTRWINTTGSTGIDQSTILSTDYSTTFSLPAGFAEPSITIQLMADNAGTVLINGVQFGQQPQVDSEINFGIVSTFSDHVLADFRAGTNTLTIRNADYGGANGIDFKAVVTYSTDSTGPVANPTRAPEPNADGWSNTDVTVDWNWTDDATEIDPANCTTSSTTTGEFGTPGQTLTATCANVAGTTSSASLTIDNVDQTAPTIAAAAMTSPNGAGWYDHTVTIRFTCTDALSGIPAGACPPDQVIDAEGSSDSTAEVVTDAAGNTSDPSDVVTVRIDTIAPTITAAATTPPDGPDGWYTSDVTIHYTCSDGGSGIPDGACPADEVLSGDGSAVASTARTVTDAAGNTSDPSDVVTVMIDTTAPVLDARVVPSPVMLNGAAQATAGATDDVSGVVSQSCDPVDTSSIGMHTVSCTATNGAGLIATADVSYHVTYRFDGFRQPVNDTGHALTCGSPCPASTFKGGSTIPVKFDLTDANGMSVEPASAPRWIVPRIGQVTDADVDEQDDSEPATTDGMYRLRGDHYSYNWSTKGFATGRFWRIGVALDDGQTYYVNIALR